MQSAGLFAKPFLKISKTYFLKVMYTTHIRHYIHIVACEREVVMIKHFCSKPCHLKSNEIYSVQINQMKLCHVKLNQVI